MFSYDEIIRKYENYKDSLREEFEEGLSEAADELEKDIKKRIFEDGKDSNDATIGESYSTKPITVTPKVFIDKSAFKGKKSMKLNYGYKELRDIQNLPTDKVRLDYSGNLKNSFKARRDKLSIIIGFDEEGELKKGRSLEKKYGTQIFSPSPAEDEKAAEKAKEILLKIYKDHFGRA